jgi:methyl-accepting chemotaxis protein
MNFDEAISAHSQWKNKLASYIAKPDHSLNAVEVAADNKCPLGQWLYGEGKKHSSMPEFSKLVSEHAHFHRAASNVIKKADSGANVTQEVALGSNSEFASASSAVVQALMSMKSKVKA